MVWAAGRPDRPQRQGGVRGIRWPSELWRDEPIPDFHSAPQGDGGGAAALVEQPAIAGVAPTIDAAQLADLIQMFPTGAAQLRTIATLLAQEPSAERVQALFAAMREFATVTATGFNDGEAAKSGQPGMLGADQKP